MSLHNKGFPAESSSGLEITHPIPIAVIILVLIRTSSVCNAENAKVPSTYDHNSVSNTRQGCIGDTCCSPPYDTEPRSFWSYAKTKYSCCVPKAERNRINCCPYPLIPSKEPNVDPSFGPFCCDQESGHCCSKVEIALQEGKMPEYLYSEPINGKCCPTHDTRLRTDCCSRPLLSAYISTYPLYPNTNPSKPRLAAMCCSHPKLCRSKKQFDDVPSLRFCSPRGFCCPWPYVALMEIIVDEKFNTLYIDRAPQFNAKYDNQCSSPTKICTLPQVPWNLECIEQQFATEVYPKDTPLYDIIPREFTNPDPSTTASSSNVQCLKDDPFRRTFGNPFLKPESHSVAINWFVTSPYVQRSKLLNETYVREKIWTWPDFIIPFIFPITIVTVSVATAVPALLLGAIGWALVFNFRFLWIKKVRMAIRRIFVCIEKRRRIIQDNYLPPEDQRKLYARDRYQLPKALQDSDLSDDDEPADLRRQRVDVIESNWTAEEIDALGFDPDNIPVDWIYGDLLGNPSALRKEVIAYNSAAKASGKPMLIEDDETMKRLDFEEWRHFLSNGETNAKDDFARKRATLEMKRSIQRHQTHTKISSKRVKVRIKIKPSHRVHEIDSSTNDPHENKIRKSKIKKKKKRHRKAAK